MSQHQHNHHHHHPHHQEEIQENSYSAEKLNEINNEIEKMDKEHHKKILSILVNYKTKVNENRAGCFLNITYLNDNVIEEIEKYINFVKEQTTSLNEAEKEKEQYKSTFFTKT